MRAFLVILLLSVRPSYASRKKTPIDWMVKTAGDALVAAPQDKEVCFSPDESCDVKLWKFIQTAQKSLDVAIYDITHEKIVHELLVASKKITVRIIVDRKQSKGHHSLVGLLIKGGANVKFGKQRGIMHDKFIVVDGKRLETGSFNYSSNAYRNNQENQIYLDDPTIVQRYVRQFEKMWNDANTASADVATN